MKKINIHHKLILLYIFSIPIVDIASFSQLVPIPLILGLLIFISSRKIVYDKNDAFIILAVFFTWLPYFWGLEYIGYKTISHIVAMVVAVLIYYFSTKTIIRKLISNGHGYIMIKVICYSLIVSSLYILVEYIMNNFLGVNIDKYIPHMARGDYGALVLDGVYRARGFATESGVMAIYFEMYIFILLGLHKLYSLLKVSNRLITITLVLSFMGLMLLFSTASILVLCTGFIYLVIRQGISLKGVVVSYLSLMLIVVAFHEQLINFIENTFLNKIAFFYSEDKVGSAYERSQIYSSNIDVVINFPFGVGHGISPEVTNNNTLYFGHELLAGQGSLFLLFLVSGGVFSVLCLILWVINKIISVKEGDLKNYTVAGILSMTAHYMLVSEYWLPFFWFSMALYSEMSLCEKIFYEGRKQETLGGR